MWTDTTLWVWAIVVTAIVSIVTGYITGRDKKGRGRIK